MRRGFSLAELLAVMVVLTAASFALAGLFSTVITDVPRSYRVMQTNTTLLNMLERMREDVDAAKGLPASFGESTANEELLLIEMKDGVISYQIRDDKVLRRNIISTDDSEGEDTRVWSVPHAKVQWQVWRENGKGYAVQVRTHIEHEVWGHWEKKMANSHLYFVGALGEAFK